MGLTSLSLVLLCLVAGFGCVAQVFGIHDVAGARGGILKVSPSTTSAYSTLPTPTAFHPENKEQQQEKVTKDKRSVGKQ